MKAPICSGSALSFGQPEVVTVPEGQSPDGQQSSRVAD